MKRWNEIIKIIKISFAFLFVIAICFFSFREDSVCKSVQKMSTEERFFLEYFFRALLLYEGGAHVLTGKKPAALGDFFSPELEKVIFFGNRLLKKEILLKKGYETWKKYQDLFPMTRYVLICNEDKNEELFHILLVHREKFLGEVARNIEDFRRVLGAHMTPELILSSIIQKKESCYEALNQHSALEGIILGFGKHNSWLFYRRDLLDNRNFDFKYIPKKHELIENEINKINGKLKCLNSERNKLYFAALPRFLFDPEDTETRDLLLKYTQSRKEFTRHYRKGNFLEGILRELTS
jgi:hypothetical protein